jgi:hypothetical protein
MKKKSYNEKRKLGRETLTGNYGDSYIKGLIRKQLNISTSEIPFELIELNRSKLKVLRKLKKIIKEC